MVLVGLADDLFLELDRIQQLLEALAGREDHAGIGDIAHAQIDRRQRSSSC